MENVVNINYKMDICEKYHNSIPWQLFSTRICGNQFVVDYLTTRENHRCACCEKKFVKKPVIHHIDYDNECVYSNGIWINSPTKKQPNRTILVPDCQTCSTENKNKFDICMSKIAIVHTYCNKIISDQFRFSKNSTWGYTHEYFMTVPKHIRTKLIQQHGESILNKFRSLKNNYYDKYDNNSGNC